MDAPHDLKLVFGWLAHPALLDGAQHEELVRLAKAGNFGAQPGNCHRDIMASFCNDVSICEPHEVEVRVIHPKTSKEEPGFASHDVPPPGHVLPLQVCYRIQLGKAGAFLACSRSDRG